MRVLVYAGLHPGKRGSLPGFDVYEERDAVRGAQLVGRDAEVSALRTRVVRGDAMGLFGLRKMGKTSVMRAVTDWFDPASGVADLVALPDLQGPGVAVVVDANTMRRGGPRLTATSRVHWSASWTVMPFTR